MKQMFISVLMLINVDIVLMKAVECPKGEQITNSGDVTESGTAGKDFTFNCIAIGLTGTLKCGENGIWTEQKGCPATIKGSVLLSTDFFMSQNCAEKCAKTAKCSFVDSEQVNGVCVYYPAPVIYEDLKTQSLTECIKKCKDDTKCLTVHHYQNRCILFNANIKKLHVKKDIYGIIVQIRN
ncbi:hypothetical protein LOTGIDRAFT_175378 [Lottia gigantea]|uniref:PAN-3 domain-containing protein n=1 Tax=Lottia gigantea TaxID=225164 RepID=V4AHI4_LOTGI|nr:hypothetical protein LOTGIDRAFT_175378 [Lottia gigantea]ESO94660.1 hypothetical protein LOTGIDRAFT_175378 [Lottia gigantea]